jgi:CheY-like chemotaxis protein
LRLAERHPPALVLLDLVLPDQSGLAPLTELKSTRATADVLIIAVTARTDLLARAAELADALVANRSTLRSCWPKISVVCERSSLRTNGMQFIASGVDLPTRYKPGRSAGADHCRATLTLPEHRAGFGNDPEGR